MNRRSNGVARGLIGLTAAGSLAGMACGQSVERAVFAANNGNLEGAVSSLILDGQDRLVFVQKLVIGTRPNLQTVETGCNAYELALSPDGRYLAVSHASGEQPMEQITIVEVGADARLTLVGEFPVPGTPMDLVWIEERRLAALRTDGSPDAIVVYDFDPSGPALREVSVTPAGSSTFYLAKHPTRPYLYANDSGAARRVLAYRIEQGGSLTLIDEELTGPFPLDMALSPGGEHLYAACGISGTGRHVLGFVVEPDGTLTALPQSPFTSLGQSPSHVAVAADGQSLVVGHGTDATAHPMRITAGTVVPTGYYFDVGLQGTLGDVQTLPGLMFLSDNSTAIDGIAGVYSFSLDPSGAFTQNGLIATTGANQPNRLAVWDGAGCYADCDTGSGTGVLDVFDFLCFQNRWAAGAAYACDCDTGTGLGVCNVFDFLCFQNRFEGGCR
jgi:6-phosphogluconolactonase (cycloisomerase 2 family)